MMMSSNGKIFRVTGHLVPGEFPAQRPVTGSYNDSFSYMVATTDKGYLMCVYTYKYRLNVWYVFILACCSLAFLLDSVSLVSSISLTCFWTHTSDLSVLMLKLEILYWLF